MNKVIAISGSNQVVSINSQLLNQTISGFENSEVTLLDLTQYPLPLYSQAIEAEGMPENVQKIWDILAKHNALVLAVPEHNGFMPAFLKNTIDWLSRMATKDTGFFATPNIPVMLLSTSPGGNGGATGLETLKNLMPWWGGEVKQCLSLGDFFDHCPNGEFTQESSQTLKQLALAFEADLK